MTLLPKRNGFDKTDVKKIVQDPVFCTLFQHNEAIYRSILENMKKRGFREDKPLILWGDTLIEGHHRLKASKEAGIDQVPIIRMEFESQEEALDFSISEQCNRRNMSNGDKIRLIRLLHKQETEKAKERQGSSTSEEKGKASEKISEKLNMSATAVERFLRIMKSGDEGLLKQVEDEKVSVYVACEILKKQNAEKSVTEDVSGQKAEETADETQETEQAPDTDEAGQPVDQEQPEPEVSEETQEKAQQAPEEPKSEEKPAALETTTVTKKELLKLLKGIPDDHALTVTVEFCDYLRQEQKKADEERKARDAARKREQREKERIARDNQVFN